MTKTVYYTHKFESPESEAIAGAWYNADSRELWVDFKTGSRAGYKGVHNYIWNQFNNADSKGGFFASKIRGYYAGISGDVTFVPGYDDTATSIPSTPESPAPVETRATSEFKVKFSVRSEGVFSVDATSTEEALRLLSQADLSSYLNDYSNVTVKEVTQVFDN